MQKLITMFLVLLFLILIGCSKEENIDKMSKTNKSNIQTQQQTDTEKTNKTKKYNGSIQLKLVDFSKSGNKQDILKVVFEVKNNLDVFLDEYSLDISLRNKNGGYLGESKQFKFFNIKSQTSATEDHLWENLKPSDVGEILIHTNAIVIDGKSDRENNYKICEELTEIISNKFGIKVHF